MNIFLRVFSVHGKFKGVTIMKPSGRAFRITVLSMVMAGLFLSSCGKSKDQEKKDQEQQEQEKAIKMLDEIESVNESIILILNGPAIPGKGEGQEEQQDNKEQQNQQQDQQQEQDNGNSRIRRRISNRSKATGTAGSTGTTRPATG